MAYRINLVPNQSLVGIVLVQCCQRMCCSFYLISARGRIPCNLVPRYQVHLVAQVACKLAISVTLISHQINTVLYFVKYVLL